jgi:hypothetical protein
MNKSRVLTSSDSGQQYVLHRNLKDKKNDIYKYMSNGESRLVEEHLNTKC